MPDMQRLDGSIGDAQPLGWIAPPTLPVCKHAQVQHRGEGSWPFLYSYRGGHCFVNKAKPKTNYQQATEIGDALL